MPYLSLSDPALPREMAEHGFPGTAGYCTVCGCTLYYVSDIRAGECAGCYGWGARVARHQNLKKEAS